LYLPCISPPEKRLFYYHPVDRFRKGHSTKIRKHSTVTISVHKGETFIIPSYRKKDGNHQQTITALKLFTYYICPIQTIQTEHSLCICIFSVTSILLFPLTTPSGTKFEQK